MAKKITIERICDMSVLGYPADSGAPHSFMLDGKDYEVDLCEGHAAEFYDLMVHYAAVARRVRAKTAPARTAARRKRAADIRAWARDQGIWTVPDGRLPSKVIAAYEARH